MGMPIGLVSAYQKFFSNKQSPGKTKDNGLILEKIELIENYLKTSVYKRALSQVRISCIQSL